MTVGLVFVSHSAKIADGLVDLARQMAPDVSLVAAGGMDDGGIGTSFDLVTAAIARAQSGDGVVILCDLGSAILTAETALDFLDDDERSRVGIVDAPLVEGGVVAAVAAQTGADLDGVAAAARTAVPTAVAPSPAAGATESPAYSRVVTLVNRDGLHARPAADFVTLAGTFPSEVTVNGQDATSLLAIMALGLVRGSDVEIATADPEGRNAVDALAALLASGFGEG
ncbi:dihydroxyacetone kinase phosphoryl donor subunit DhaM [Paeniglutamicibacter kerguelensis]|uniref:Phosphocarrier protein HPr n=1 Tax=Paeniglutamicibacter kerguelensis TaxID=254788 RepID=A0ABS4X9M4_9MICC|nr:dihydroxyacetone kinase phosphoryl donor subunit DhaM [Paeniglutamicibacter kerguelensis]MBP2385168.1 PTS hybrid protein [Paeniglutamicibacter kerguelensis]